MHAMAERQTNGSGTNHNPDFYAGYSRFEIELEVGMHCMEVAESGSVDAASSSSKA